jgi:hypothetical protein
LEVGRARQHEVVGVGGQAVHQGRRDFPVFLDVGIQRRELVDVLDEHRRRRAGFEAKIHEARLGRSERLVMVDDREDLDPFGVGQLGVEFERIDERKEVHLACIVHAPDLA